MDIYFVELHFHVFFKSLNSSFYFSIGLFANCNLIVLLFNSPRIYILSYDVSWKFYQRIEEPDIKEILEEIRYGHLKGNDEDNKTKIGKVKEKEENNEEGKEENEKALINDSDNLQKKGAIKKIPISAVFKYHSVRKVFF